MKKIAVTLTMALLLNGCQGDPNTTMALTTLGGAALGGVAGHQINDDNGRYVGAALGALAGAAVANYMNNQQAQLQQQVQQAGIQVNRIDDSTIQLNIQSEILFDNNQSTIKPNFYPTLDNIAQTLNQYPETIVHIYGFTDGIGTESHNQQLSERRAQSTASYLTSRGVMGNRFITRGLGERYATAERNPGDRRVEIYIRAIDQNNPQAAYTPVY